MIRRAKPRKNNETKYNKNNTLSQNNVICNQPVAGSIPIASSKYIKALGTNLRPFLLFKFFWSTFKLNLLR